MAPSAKHFPFVLLFFALLSPLLSHARESYFFNKATTTTSTTGDNSAKKAVEEVMPNKSNVQEEQDPSFIPDTQSGYGLYGRNSGRNPTTSSQPSDSFEPYTTATSSSSNNNNYYKNDAYMVRDTRFMDGRYTTTAAPETTGGQPYTATTRNNNEAAVSDSRFMDRRYAATAAAGDLPYNTESGEPYPTTNNNYYNREAYASDPREGMDHDTRFTSGSYATAAAAAAASNNNNYFNGGGGGNYNTQQQQQGMSDTRFLENGRYYYDVNSEGNYQNGYQNSRRVNSNNNRGYYGNYNENSYENGDPMAMEGYQNQDGQFQGNEAEYVP